MWKVILILFMTTGGVQPDSIAITEFPVSFIQHPKCNEFIDTHRGAIQDYVNLLWNAKSKDLVALHHKIVCIQDTSGEAV